VAEQRAAKLPAPVTYVATAIVAPDDPDHAARVEIHRARRDPAWSTIEPGRDLAGALHRLRGSVLVDSLGSWLAIHDGFAAEVGPLCTALTSRHGDTVIVSEEVGLGVHPSTATGRVFRDALGEVNVAVAAIADEALLVLAGRVLPLGRA
jgi:adenosylcobinamide kinase/adenosylcobinamide-phosphate guanylyltransferase